MNNDEKIKLREEFEIFRKNREEFNNFLKLKEKSKKGIINITGKYFNDLQLIESILTLLSTVKGVNLRPFSRKVLKYYIKYGYTKEAVEYVIEDYLSDRGITNPTEEDLKKIDGSIRVADTDLRKLGYLLLGETNLRKSRLSSEMENLRKKVLENNDDYIVIDFTNVV